MKILIELYMDGYSYSTEKDHKQACIGYIEECLDSAAVSVKVLWAEDIKDE